MKQLKSGAVLALAMTGLLSACGGGGGGSDGGSAPTPAPSVKTLSGTAATGAPIVGTVTIKDAMGKIKDVKIAADGSYSVDVSDLTAPLLIRASGTVAGRTVSLYSAAMASDLNKTVNITPFTDLILANVAGGLAEKLFNGTSGKTLSEAELTKQQQSLRDRLLPVLKKLGLADSIDLLHSAFKADKTGLDAVLDILKVEIDPDTLMATIRNVLTGESIKDDLLNQNDSDKLPEPQADLSQTQKDLAELQAQFKTYVAQFNLGDTPAVREKLAAFVADGYLYNGDNKQNALDLVASGIKLHGDIDMLSVDGEKKKYCFRFAIDDNKSTEPGSSDNCAVKGSDSQWRLVGNGRLVNINVGSFAYWLPDSNKVSNGMGVGIGDTHNIARYAVVTGPGYPDGGVAMVNNAPNNNWYRFEDVKLGYDILDSGNGLDLSKVVKDGVYTVRLYKQKGDAQPLAVYQEKLDVVPLPDAVIAINPALRFATITSPKTLADVSGASFTMAWTMPAQTKTRWVEVGVGTEDYYVHFGDAGRAVTSKKFDRSSASAPTFGAVWVQIIDRNGRHFGTTRNLKSVSASVQNRSAQALEAGLSIGAANGAAR